MRSVRSKPGKQADFVIHDFDDYRELAYFFGVRLGAVGLYWRGRLFYPAMPM